jgi:hypothetical protein
MHLESTLIRGIPADKLWDTIRFMKMPLTSWPTLREPGLQTQATLRNRLCSFHQQPFGAHNVEAGNTIDAFNPTDGLVISIGFVGGMSLPELGNSVL